MKDMFSTSSANVAADVSAGAASYTPRGLAIYDWAVLSVVAPYLWRCPTSEILKQYNANVSANHLDIGIGTGYFLDNCAFPVANPKISLLDLNPNCVEYVAERIRRYSPRKHVASALDPLPLPPASVDSIGMNYLLHCLPGPMERKTAAFKHARPILRDGGVLFGATLLGRDWSPSLPARLLMESQNRKGAFSNLSDDLAGLEAGLRDNFKSCVIRLVGGMALFVART